MVYTIHYSDVFGHKAYGEVIAPNIEEAIKTAQKSDADGLDNLKIIAVEEINNELKSENDIYKKIIDITAKAYDDIEDAIIQLCPIYYDDDTKECDGCPCYNKQGFFNCRASSVLDDLELITSYVEDKMKEAK